MNPLLLPQGVVSPIFNVPTPNDSVVPAGGNTPVTTTKKHGTIDNVLGFLGDFLTSRLRMGTPYRDARQAEKINAARIADTADPSQTYANLGNLDPALAVKLQQGAADDRRLAAAQAGVQETRDARLADMQDRRRKDVLDRAANYFNNLTGDPSNIETRYAEGRRLWSHSSTVKNDPELQQLLEDMYPEKYDPHMITSSIATSVPVSTQWAQRLTANRDESTDRRGAARIAATLRGQDLNHADRQESMVRADARAAAGRAASAARGSGTRKASNIQSYVGRDGYKYTQRSDGTAVRSLQPVKITSGALVENPDGSGTLIKIK